MEKLKIDKKYITENNPENFLEKVYLILGNFVDNRFLNEFSFEIQTDNFSNFFKIVKEIFSILSDKNYKNIKFFVEGNKEKKDKIDEYIILFSLQKLNW